MKEPETLSIHRSFIVRLYPGINPDAGDVSGLVEHIISGKAGEFRSVGELLHFISRLLRREETGAEVEKED